MSDPKEIIDERNGVKIYGGGVKGIRALKQEKTDGHEDNEEAKSESTHKDDRFKRIEHRISKKSRLIIK